MTSENTTWRTEAKLHVLAKIIVSIAGDERMSKLRFSEREQELLRSMLEDEYPDWYRADINWM